MKKYILSILAIAASYLNLTAQNMQWGLSVGTSSTDYGISTDVDAAGNMYFTGSFNGTADFDAGPGTATLVSSGSMDVFIAKYSTAGVFLWVKRIGGSSGEIPRDLTVDAAGNIYVTGNFGGTMDFDPGVGVANLTSPGSSLDVFFAKYDTNGDYVWARNAGTSGNTDDGLRIFVDGASNVYVTGWFRGTADFDPSPSTANLISSGNTDAFLAKYNVSGNYVWAKSIGGTGYEYGQGITVDASGNVYVAGYFEATVDFDPSPATFTLSSYGNEDAFLAKYDVSGNYVWAKKIGGTLEDEANDLVLGANNQLYVTGIFQSTVNFDQGVGSATLSTPGTNVFLANYDLNGTYGWSKRIGSNPFIWVYDMDVDASSNIYLSGTFDSTTDFDPSAAVNNLTSNGSQDTYFAKYDQNGNYLLAQNLGGSSVDFGMGVACDGSGNIYVVGYYQATIDLDPGVGTNTYTANGGNDVFFGKYSPSIPANIKMISSNDSKIKVFPNPNNGVFSIVDENNLNYNKPVKIMNAIGEIIYNETPSSESPHNFSHLSPGLYFIVLEEKQTTTYVKVLIQ